MSTQPIPDVIGTDMNRHSLKDWIQLQRADPCLSQVIKMIQDSVFSPDAAQPDFPLYVRERKKPLHSGWNFVPKTKGPR